MYVYGDAQVVGKVWCGAVRSHARPRQTIREQSMTLSQSGNYQKRSWSRIFYTCVLCVQNNMHVRSEIRSYYMLQTDREETDHAFSILDGLAPFNIAMVT